MKILKGGEFYGQKKKELHINGVTLSEYSYVVPNTDWHYHENPYFMYLLQGQIYDVNKKTTTHCNPGSLIFHNWQEKHFNRKHAANADAKGFHIELKNNALEKLQLKSLTSEGSISIKNPNAHFLLARLYHEFHVKDAFSPIGIESLLIALCRNIEMDDEIQTTEPDWLKQLTNLIYENQEPLSLKELSFILNVHPVHISRTFSGRFGHTLSEYMRMIKLKRALPHVLNARLSLTEISYVCGFADQSHFTRTFKQYLGISPGRYRAQFNS